MRKSRQKSLNSGIKRRRKMKIIKTYVTMIMALFFIGSALDVAIFAQDKSQSEEDQKMMKMWMEYATPGENHKYLEYFTGQWNVNTKMWMKPGGEPEVSTGECTARMILGGRYLETTYTGMMMGMPFEGLSISGYDNFKKEFISIWLDNAGTGIYQTSGTLDMASKTRTETGLWDDIMTGKKSKVKWVTKVIDDNKYIFEMYGTDPMGKEFKSGEIVYTRKK
jgi:hypothetical protein